MESAGSVAYTNKKRHWNLGHMTRAPFPTSTQGYVTEE